MTVDEAYQPVRHTGLDLLAVLRAGVGSLNTVVRPVEVLGMANAIPEFADHPKIISGCSDLFGDQGGMRVPLPEWRLCLSASPSRRSLRLPDAWHGSTGVRIALAAT
ncbi:RidA family protein [Dankookia rubra]|uniref:hypothetical protein n=1 Tax=Dankookia rubra TaxID=1442381 RepID=UPI0019D5D10F|nr:hypothetical protein [Dankookia rubra]